MLIDFNGVYVESSLVAVVRPVNGDQTAIFTAGQSAVDGGHLIDLPCDEVIERLQEIQAHAFAERLLQEIEADREKSLTP
jgi:hypothetical protein